MRRYKPASGTPKKKPAPFPGGSKPVGGKGKGRGSLTMVDATTGKRVRKGPTPFPGSPPRGRTKRGKDGIDILIPDKPRKGKGKELKIGEVKQKKLSPAALRSKRLKEKESLDKYAESLPLKKRGRDNKPLSKAAALRERRLRAAALRRKRLKEKKGTPKEPFNPIDKVPGGRPDPLLRARRRRAAAAANKANRSAVRSDNEQAASDLAKFNAARKRQAKKATPTARRTAKPVGDRKVPVSRRIR